MEEEDSGEDGAQIKLFYGFMAWKVLDRIRISKSEETRINMLEERKENKWLDGRADGRRVGWNKESSGQW